MTDQQGAGRVMDDTDELVDRLRRNTMAPGGTRRPSPRELEAADTIEALRAELREARHERDGETRRADYAQEQCDPFAWVEGLDWHKPAHRAAMASVKLGGWMSAALDDPDVCDAMKADIQEWFSAGEHLSRRSRLRCSPRAGGVAVMSRAAAVDAFVAYYRGLQITEIDNG